MPLASRITVACVVWLSVLGCAGEVDIIGRCELETEAVRVLDPAVHGAVNSPSVGAGGGRVFLSWNEWPESGVTWQKAQWLDESLMLTGEETLLGASDSGYRTQWLWDGEAMRGQVWADPDGDSPFPDPATLVHTWTFPPPGGPSPTARQIDMFLPTGCEPGFACFVIGNIAYSSGFQTMLPSVLQPDETLRSAVIKHPRVCARTLAVSSRLVLFGDGWGQERPVVWGDECDEADHALRVSNPWFIPRTDGRIDLLIRLGQADDGRVRLLTLEGDDEATISRGPRAVGGAQFNSGSDGGYQPHGVRVRENRLLFTERRGDHNDCHALRLVDGNGSDADDASWQIPCMDEGSWKTTSVELLPLDGAAVLVWTERTVTPGLRVTATTQYVERIRAVLVTAIVPSSAAAASR